VSSFLLPLQHITPARSHVSWSGCHPSACPWSHTVAVARHPRQRDRPAARDNGRWGAAAVSLGAGRHDGAQVQASRPQRGRRRLRVRHVPSAAPLKHHRHVDAAVRRVAELLEFSVRSREWRDPTPAAW